MKKWGLGIIVILFGSLYALLAANQHNNQITNKQTNNSEIVTEKGLGSQGASLKSSNKFAARLQNKGASMATVANVTLSKSAKLANSVISDKSDRVTVAGVLSQKSGVVLCNQVIYAKSSVEDIKLSTDGEGDFFVHLLGDQKYTLTTSDGLQLGSITTGDMSRSTNDDGIIELGRTFRSQSSSGYIQLNSNTIYFPKSEVISAGNNEIIINGTQDVYVGDVVLADGGLNHADAATVKITSVQHENNKTILNGTSITMTSLFQEIHSGSHGSFSTVKILPNTQVASLNQSGNSLTVDDGQGSTLNVEVATTPSLDIDYSSTRGMKQIVASFKTTAKIQGHIRAEGTKVTSYNIGNAIISTDIPFLSVDVPLTLNESLQAEKGSTVDVTGEYTSNINLQINNNELMKTASHEVTTDLSASTNALHLNLGVGVAPNISIAGNKLLSMNNYLGFSDNVDADLNETQDSHYSAEVESPLLERPYSFEEDTPLFRTANMQVNTDTSGAVTNMTLTPGETKILYLPEYRGSNADLTSNTAGPISITKLSNGVYELTADEDAVTGGSASLTFLDTSLNGHLISSKADLTVNIVQSDKSNISGDIVNDSNKVGIKNAQVTLVNEATGETYSTITDESGKYTMELPRGNYQSTVTASGYNSGSERINVNTDESVYGTELSLSESSLHGVIKNSVTGANIDGVSLSFRSGSDNTTGELVGTTITDGSGAYSLNLPTGNYTVEIVKDGFVTSYKNITVNEDTEGTGMDASLLPSESVVGS
ncbi:carboxypeptidase-like regulatory domain-containing protein [Liquorilactobacillus mali]|uniref:carboxypeptidase-like regulatory domain-containing protein n=1 Tax=Liquorilactobacillus mali TaxID=1618 RepID=UPI0029532B63|nr:carboxypeptidase-like regulatory domain-containing protein [Liquorilactobacillus mali]MDV7758336.1 hypothetical protein [Liquorilactobacillus mali]